MRVRDRLYWVGSGLLGMNLTDELDCNVYLLDGGGERAIIDCGSGYGVPAIMERVRQAGFDSQDIQYMLLTHAHMDHAGGAALMKGLTDAKVCASQLTAKLIETGDEEGIGLPGMREAGVYPTDCRLTPCKVDLKLTNGEQLKIGDLTLEVIAAPGHSRDMINYYCPELRLLFSGDNVFVGGRIAAIRTEDFSIPELSQSLARLLKLEVDSLMPGHYSPVVRDGGKAIRQATEAFARGEIPQSIV